MSRRPLIALLAVGALVAAVLNIRFWTSGPSALADTDEEWESGSDDALEALPPLDRDEVAAYLRSLPESGVEHSPFFTREESLRLASAPDAMTPDAKGHVMRLDGTLYGAARRVAWLDGHPQSEGDEVANYRVAGIEIGAVTLVRGEETLRLELGGGHVHEAADDEDPIDAE